MSAGVGKTYRMLQEAHALLRNGIDIQIGYIETHNRAETQALVDGLPFIPAVKHFTRGKKWRRWTCKAILNRHPEVVIVDELAHSNIEGSKNSKRWQDVLDILEAGISVITAVNIQHLESLNEEIESITGIAITERVFLTRYWNWQTRS
jgi:two-component system sensor histidine kinase KdpD